MGITKKYSKEITELIPSVTNVTGKSLNLIVDMGHAFIKTSLIATYEGDRHYLLHAELKETGKIINNGEINFNLLSRYVSRKAIDLSDFGKINQLIVIPPRIYTNMLPMYNLEYIEKYREFKGQVTKNYKEIFANKSNIDWGTLINDPHNDFRNIVIDSLTDENAIKFGNAFVNVPVDSTIVTSPAMSYLGIKRDKPFMIIDLGHITTTIVIIDEGIAYLRNVSVGGNAITETLTDKEVTVEEMKYKHSLEIDEYPEAIEFVTDTLIGEIVNAIDEYKTITLNPLEEYCILGGTGNIRLEELLNDLRTGLKRFYPKVDLEKSSNLPTEVVNYFLPSFSTHAYLHHSLTDKERRIDFTASKGNALQYRIKKIADWFRKNKVMTLAITSSMYLIFGALLLTADRVNKYQEEVATQYNVVQGENASVSSQLSSANAELALLMSSEMNGFNYDTGALLDKIKEITPPNLNVRQFNLNSIDDTGTIVVASPNQVITATLITLLQDGDNAPFTKADIIEIKKETDALEEVYITTIYVEGRNL